MDRYTNTVVYPGKVMIAVKAELVADSIEQVDMINSIRWCVWSQQFHRKVSPKLVFGWTLLPFSGDGLPNVEGLDLSLYPATKEIRWLWLLVLWWRWLVRQTLSWLLAAVTLLQWWSFRLFSSDDEIPRRKFFVWFYCRCWGDSGGTVGVARDDLGWPGERPKVGRFSTLFCFPALVGVFWVVFRWRRASSAKWKNTGWHRDV